MSRSAPHIAYLADVPAMIPPLAAAFQAEWPDYYGRWTLAEIESELEARSRRDGLPIALVALDGAAAVGTATLHTSSIASHRYLTPWLMGFFVAPEQRRNGLGASLIGAIERLACRHGYPAIYAASGPAAPLFVRAGWQAMEQVVSDGEAVTVLRRSLPNERHDG